MTIPQKIIGKILGDKVSKNQEIKNWYVQFDGGFSVTVSAPQGTPRDKIMLLARNRLSEANRYNFDARRASGGKITRVQEIK